MASTAAITSAAVGLGTCLSRVLIPQCGYLKDYQTNVRELRDKASQLRSRKKDIEDRIEAGKFNSNETKKEVDDWLKRADTALAKYGKMQHKIMDISGCCRPWWGSRYWIGRKVPKTRAKFESIIKSGEFGDEVFGPPTVPASRLIRMASDVKFQHRTSTEVALDEVMEGLKAENVLTVGVHGMGGVGKTTMVRQVREKVLEEKIFNYVVMVTVSRIVDVENIQILIGEQLGVDFSGSNTEATRAVRLSDGIQQGKNVLIVLDDVWEKISLASIGIPDLKSSESKILIASRSKDVISKDMGIEKVVHLGPWSKEDSWSLMKETTGLDFSSPGNFLRVGKSVTKECGGLPLAIVAVANALKGEKDVGEWEKALTKLRDNDPMIPESVYKSLKLSYDFLKHKSDKEYFRMCCLFPEDHNISKQELARYGKGLDWFYGVSTMKQVRDRGDECAKRLISSGLLLEGDKDGHVKMHDLLRDFSIWMTSLERVSNEAGSREQISEKPIYEAKAGRGLDHWPKMEPKHCNAISLMFNKIKSLPDSLDSPELKVLLLQENTSLKVIPNNFFTTTESLRVLSLNKIGADLLPRSISSLSNLRTLFLDHCIAKDFSFIESLVNLEILSLRQCNIDILPLNMGNLKNLRILDLALCKEIHSIPRTVLGELTALEELYLQGSVAKWENKEGNTCFSDLMNLPYLSTLKVDIENPQWIPPILSNNPKWMEFHICISSKENTRVLTAHSSALRAHSRNLVINTSMNNLPEWFVELVSSKVEWLMYTECPHLDLIEEYNQGQLSGLKSLLIEQCGETMPLMSFADGNRRNPVFENLQELRIHYIDYRTEICVGELPPRSLEKLEFLDIQQCADLKNSLLASNLIKRLNKLTRLNASGAPDVTEVFGFEGLPDGVTVLQALEEMRLFGLGNLKSLCKGSTTFMRFNKLKCLIVTKCRKLTNLFSESVAESLVNLEVLWIEDCERMEDIINTGDEITREKIILPKLKTITLQKLKVLCRFTSGNATLETPMLEHIYKDECPRFTTMDYSEFHSTNTIIVNNEQHSKFLRRRYSHLFEC